MKSIFAKKAIIIGSTLYKPGSELSVPDQVGEKEAAGLVKSGYAVDATAKSPTPEKEAVALKAIETAKKAPEVEKVIDSVEKPTPGILDAAATKVKSFSARLPRKKPGSRMGE